MTDVHILCTVDAVNGDHAVDVYRFLRDERKATFIQFEPLVELAPSGATVTERSVAAEQWGRFLIDVFDEWVTRDVGTVNVQMFDAALASWMGAAPSLRDRLVGPDPLPAYCRRCDVRFACNGEDPKNRFLTTPDGEPGLNYLCAGYQAFFFHIDRPMRLLADLVRQGRYPGGAMEAPG